MNLYRIVVADDHEVVRHGLRAMLEAQPNWKVVGEAADGRAAVASVIEFKPDLAVLDVGMPNLNGLEAARQIVAAVPSCRVLILSLYESEQMVCEVLAAGARGYLLKSDASKSLVKAAEVLRNGKLYVTPRFSHLVEEGLRSKRTAVVSLTARERQVVQLLGEGKSTKEVATILDMSVKTAETHRAHIMHKLDLHSITELVLYAVRNRIVQVPTPLDGVEPLPIALAESAPATMPRRSDMA
ncbi:MAG TPA: response regulator transcription factor [Terriglobales bacterium]|nr:response regulator transcription factor [Terriglobales bacterium]